MKLKELWMLTLCLLLSISAAVFPIDWANVPPMLCGPISQIGGPTLGRAEFSTAYDHINNVWVNGFGCTKPCYSSDTYEYDPVANTWETTYDLYCRGSSPGDRPGGRCSFGMCFSARDTVVMLFGGANASNPPETWLYSATRNKWTMKCRQALGGHAFEALRVVYDSVSNHFFVYDHQASQMYKYTIGGNQWASTNSSGGPSTQYCYAMAVSEKRRIILLITTGGQDYIYKIDDNAWIHLNSNASDHGPRYRAGLVYDIESDVFLLNGNKGGGKDLWELTLEASNATGVWTNVTNDVRNFSAPERGESVVYDRTHDIVLMNEYSALRSAYKYQTTARIEFTGLSFPAPSQPALDCFPNPFNSAASIIYNIGEKTNGKFNVYDIRGKLILSRMIFGSGAFTWSGFGLTPGTYSCCLFTGNEKVSKKMIVVK